MSEAEEDVRTMMREALSGIQPMLPGLEIPPELSRARLLEIYEEMQQAKIEKAKELSKSTKGDLAPRRLKTRDMLSGHRFVKEDWETWQSIAKHCKAIRI